jgi:magnesium transporter
MASARTTYRDGQGGDGAEAAAHPFVWVSLRDPSPDELAAVQREFGLPATLVDGLATAARRPVLEVTGELLYAAVKTTTWVAAEEAVRLREIQLVLGDGFVVSVDRDEAVLDHVRQDLEDDPELAGAGLAAVVPCVVDPAAEGYGPVLAALNNAVEEVEEVVFSPAESRPTERIYMLSRQVLEFRRAVAPLTEMLDRLAADSSTPAGERLKQRYRELRAHLLHLVELADGLGNLLSNVLQANLTQVSVRQNDDMRRISAWVAIWAVPTLLAGIYGMNVNAHGRYHGRGRSPVCSHHREGRSFNYPGWPSALGPSCPHRPVPVTISEATENASEVVARVRWIPAGSP